MIPAFFIYALSQHKRATPETMILGGIAMMYLASLLISTIVCFTGAIGFIGLVAPHITHMVIGGDNRFLIPASGLVEAVLLVVADMVGM